jgi:hypothetical protein
MDLINSKVQHKVFGTGRILGLNDNIVSIQFGVETRKFIFPDAFRNYLNMTEQRSRKYIDGILNEIDTKSLQKKEAEARAEEKRRTLERLPFHALSQAAFQFVENDKQRVLKSWSVFTGNYRTGMNRGKPRIPSRIYPNSACLLTGCNKNDSEEKRYIWGVYMVRDDFFGTDCMDGQIPAHDDYRMILNDTESENLLFWNMAGVNSISKWGSAEMKYLSNRTVASILHNILLMKQGTDQEQLCEEFLDYFCKLNKIDKEQIAQKLTG